MDTCFRIGSPRKKVIRNSQVARGLNVNYVTAAHALHKGYYGERMGFYLSGDKK